MIGLILEILLTTLAWRKGWRAWALLPVGIFFFLAFFSGVIIGASKGPGIDAEMAALSVGVIYEIMLIITLVVMAVVAPKSRKSENSVTQGLSHQQEYQLLEGKFSESREERFSEVSRS